jgi:hypothetical protein
VLQLKSAPPGRKSILCYARSIETDPGGSPRETAGDAITTNGDLAMGAGEVCISSGGPPRPAQRLPANQRASENACQARAIRDAPPTTLWASWENRQERFHKIPQRIWKQRGGHACSHYFADGNQMSEVLLHALRMRFVLSDYGGILCTV